MRAFARVGFLALALGAGTARAEEPRDTTDLEGLLETTVVSAPSKTAESAALAPATSVVLTAEDFKRYGIKSLDEAINFLGRGMVVEKDFQTGEIGARGVLLTSDFGSHVLLMVDGHVLNEQWSGTAYYDRTTAVPFELIDHIELVLGPGSVLYGSNAMLGIVHIVTKRAKDFQGVHVYADSEASLAAPGSTLRGAAGFGRQFHFGETPAELVFEAEYYTQSGPTFDFGPQDYGPDSVTMDVRDYDVNPADRKYPPGIWGGRGNDAYYMRAPSAYLKVRVGDVEFSTRAAVSKRTEPTDSGNFDDPASYQIDRWLHGDLKHTLQASALVKLSTRLYADAYDYNQYWTSNGASDCLAGQNNGCLWRLRGAANSVGLEPQLTLDWLEDGRLVTLVGVDGRYNRIRSDVNYFDNVTGVSPGAIGPDSPTEIDIAAYVQQTYWATRGLGFNAGARLDIDELYGSAVLPRAAVVLMPWRGGTVKGIYSEAFRAPTAFDIYYADPTTQIPGGTSLEPERVRSGELAFEQHFGAQLIELSLYYSKWRELLLGTPASDEEIDAAFARGELEDGIDEAVQIQNMSRLTSYGMDIGYRGSMAAGRLNYAIGITEAFARREEPDGFRARLAVMPHTFGNARVAYDLGAGLPTLALAGRYVPRRPMSDYPHESGDFADAAVELRLHVSGPIARSGVSYGVGATFLSATTGAYSIGSETLPNGEIERMPTDQFRLGASLAYDLPL